VQGILYEEASFFSFIIVTCLLGGWAAWMTGRACAQTWRPYIALVVYLLALGIAVRFLHHALFGGHMLAAQFYIVDTIILLVFGTLGYRYTRTKQMTRQYHWLYEKVSPFSFKAK